MHYYLGIEVWKKLGEIQLGQGKYVIKILQKFGMMNRKPMKTPIITNLKNLRNSGSILVDPTSYQLLIGSLMYLVSTQPYICFVVNTLIQFEMDPRHDQWIETNKILLYLHGTIHHCLRYIVGNEIQLLGYTNSDWAGSDADGKSTTSGCFIFGSSMVSWFNRKQDSFSLSSTKAKYIATSEDGQEVF